MNRHAFTELGLDPDADEGAVKRAYAARLKTRRPDDDPAAFQRLHEIFQAALAHVRRRAQRGPAGAVPDPAPLDAGQSSAPPPPRPQGPGAERGRPVQSPWRQPPPSRPDLPPGPPAPAPHHEPPFDRTDFVKEFAAILADPHGDLSGWLQAHPSLYSLARRDELVPVLVHLLETTERLPEPESIKVLFAFFGLDLIDRRNQHLQPRLDALSEMSRHQHRQIVGPDLSFMLKPESGPARKPARSNTWPVVPVIMLMLVLVSLARCASNLSSFKPIEPATQELTYPERMRAAQRGATKDVPVWRYQPPASLSEPDEEKGKQD
jgi:hypothetical protein